MFKRFVSIVSCIVFAGLLQAATPNRLGYQGNLADSGGQPITANLSITFRLYDVASGGSALWTETQPAVAVDGGNLAVELGGVTPLPKDIFGKQLYLGIQIAGDSEMLPRPALTAAPYALQAERTLKNTTLVSAEGTPTENGAALIAAFAALPAATADAPQTVELDAGTFDLGATPLVVPSYVTLVGRGQHTTIIKGQQASGFLLRFNSYTQGREFSVHDAPSGGASSYAIALHGAASFNDPVDEVLLSHVNVEVVSPTATSGATRFAVSACMNNSTIEHSTLNVNGGHNATALIANCATQPSVNGGNFMTLNDLRLIVSGAGTFLRGATLSGGGPWKNLFALVNVNQPTVASAYGLVVQFNLIDVGAALVDSFVVINADTALTTANASVHGIQLSSADLNVRNVRVGIEDVTAQNVRGAFVYADVADRVPDIVGLNIEVEAAQYAPAGFGEVSGITFDHAGGRLANSVIDVECDEAAYNRCVGIRRFSSGNQPDQPDRLEVDHANVAVQVLDPADTSAQAMAVFVSAGDIAVRNSSLRVRRSAEDEVAAAIQINAAATVNALVEHSTLAVEPVNPAPAPTAVILVGDNGNRTFYGNTFHGGFNVTGTATNACAGNILVGTGFLASTCP